MKDRSLHLVLLLSLLSIFIWSMIHPKELITWIFEAIPVVLGMALLILVYPRFRFADLSYILLWISFVMILVGAHYTFENVPLFEWIQNVFHLSRNHYDRMGHLAQGFTTAVIVRELLVRKSPVKQGKLLFGIAISVTLAFSVFYEILEFLSVLIFGGSSHAFLGIQGDVWDAQWDMLLALCGAIIALLTLGRYYDNLLKNFKKE